MNQALGWKSDEGAKATLAGIELWSMIKMGNSTILMVYPFGMNFTRLQTSCIWKSVRLYISITLRQNPILLVFRGKGIE